MVKTHNNEQGIGRDVYYKKIMCVLTIGKFPQILGYDSLEIKIS